jgi:hypothetical protein
VDTFIVTDVDAPSVTLQSITPLASAQPDNGDIVHIDVDITDWGTITVSDIRVAGPLGYSSGWQPLNGTFGYPWDSSDAFTDGEGTYTVYVQVEDASFNADTVTVGTFTITDTTGPTIGITSITASADPELAGVISIDADITDWAGVNLATDQYRITIFGGAYDSGWVNLGAGSNANWLSSVAPVHGIYDVSIQAMDINGNLRIMTNITTFTLVDGTDPVITEPFGSPEKAYRQISSSIDVEINATITDLSGVTAIAYISNASGPITNFPLTTTGGDFYSGLWSISPTTGLGNYTVEIYAEDGFGHGVWSSEQYINVTYGSASVSIGFVDAKNYGWVGVNDNISLTITIDASDDVNITGILLTFGIGGTQNAHFDFNSLSIPLNISVDGGVTETVTIYYDILSTAPIGIGAIGWWEVQVNYTDVNGVDVVLPSKWVDGSTGFNTIDLYQAPKVYALDWSYVGASTSDWVRTGTIRFEINGSADPLGDIDITLDLSAYGAGILTDTNFNDGTAYGSTWFANVNLAALSVAGSTTILNFNGIEVLFERTIGAIGTYIASFTCNNTADLQVDRKAPSLSLAELELEIPNKIDFNVDHLIALDIASVIDIGIGYIGTMTLLLANSSANIVSGVGDLYFLDNSTGTWRLDITRAMVDSILTEGIRWGRLIYIKIALSDTLGNNNNTLSYFTIEMIDQVAPEILSITINDEEIKDNEITIEPNKYTSITVYYDDGTVNSSKISSAIIYYTTEDASGNYLEWDSFTLNTMAGFTLYQVFPNDQVGLVGFAPGSTVTVVVVITDGDGNVAVSDEITITVKGTEEPMILASQILMAIAGAIVVGSIIYRFLRRKKVKVIDRG